MTEPPHYKQKPPQGGNILLHGVIMEYDTQTMKITKV